MPYMVMSILAANGALAPIGEENWNPESILKTIEGADTVLEAAEKLHLFDEGVLPIEQADALRSFFEYLPASIDAAILAGSRSALARGVRVQFTWEPAYDFAMRMYEVSRGRHGVVNFVIASPHPAEPEMDEGS